MKVSRKKSFNYIFSDHYHHMKQKFHLFFRKFLRLENHLVIEFYIIR
jgi:hypothetical protein